MKPNRIVMKVYGKYALFTDPMTKIGGEKSSMMIPSYETLKGIVSSMYWKPSFNWVIESVKVLNPIRTERKGIRPIKYNGGNDLAYYTYLSDVAYFISAHFEFNKRRPDLQEDWNENKHYYVAKRALIKLKMCRNNIGNIRQVCIISKVISSIILNRSDSFSFCTNWI